jgi:hypothetical protein
MDYFNILERSFTITRRHRVLWVFGFLLALFGAGGGFGNSVQYSFGSGETSPPFDITPNVGILLVVALLMVALVLAILSIIVNYVAQTALIGLVGEIEEGEEPTVRHGFDVGWSRSALRLFGADLVVFVPVGLLAAVIIATIVGGFVALANQGDPGPVIVLLICCVGLFGLFFIALLVGLGILQTFYYRHIVLSNEGVWDGVQESYRLVRANLGQVIAMWLIMLVVGLLWGVVNLVLGLIALALVGGPAAFMYAIFQSGLAAVLGALPFLLVMLVAFAIVNMLYTVFGSSVWTLTYLELPNRPAEA